MHKSVRILLLLAVAGCGRCDDTGDETQPLLPVTPGWVEIPGGDVIVGSPADELCRDPDERQRLVGVPAFAIARYEVTQREFQERTGKNPSFHGGCDGCPVDSVTLEEASAYCMETGDRLPTEDEWERAARANTVSPFYAGPLESCMATDAVAGRIGWYKANSGGFSHPVGQKAANAYGLHDMSGNVYELTSSLDGDRAIVRGGSWYHNAHHARSANRMTVATNRRLSYVGFRCVRGGP